MAGIEGSNLVGEAESTAEGGSLVFLETGEPSASDPLRRVPEAAANDPLGQRAAGHAMLERGDRAGGIAAFERALAIYRERNEWPSAWQAASELAEAEPQRIAHYQTRVEIASNLNDHAKRTEAYLDLGDALRRVGSDEKAIAVFRRVLDLEPEQVRALAALRDMTPTTAVRAGDEGFVDFRAMVVDDAPRTTRMRTETTRVSADEDETFREALAEFKRALDENMPIEDSQAHYDLGVAFKEMGLLDEAVSSFQKALRSTEGRLRTSEALGQTFFDQGRVAVAEAVLRNVERGPESEAEKIGVLYWLGRSLEAQHKFAEALACYQRVLAVDVLFMDVSVRMLQVTDHRV
jgi:tetratricopeptide (TPR) repeat protein